MRRRRREEAQRGNVNALKHGVFATVAGAQEVAVEVELIFALRPGLDRLRDRRLVEHLASTNVARQRALLAIETEGHTSTLTSYVATLGPLVERLERQVHERERERLAAAKDQARTVDLEAYRSRSAEVSS